VVQIQRRALAYLRDLLSTRPADGRLASLPGHLGQL
jgi:hypothetical protein